MMKIGFDYGGTLDVRAGSNAVPLRELARSLLLDGHEVHIISALDGQDDEQVQADIASWDIPFTAFHPVRFDGDPEVRIDNRAGINKVKVMQQHGITMIIDDNIYICEEVRKAGLLAIRVTPP